MTLAVSPEKLWKILQAQFNVNGLALAELSQTNRHKTDIWPIYLHIRGPVFN